VQYLSAITTQASGSAGGVTASHNQHARYLRARTTPTDPATGRQRWMRGRFAMLSSAWTGWLTPAQRHAWDTYAVNVLMRNALGDPIHLTGRHHFFRSNLATRMILPPLSVRRDAPTIFNKGQHSAINVKAGYITSEVRVYFAQDDAWNTELGGFLTVFESRPQSLSINFWAGPYTYLGAVPGNPDFPEPGVYSFQSNYRILPDQRIFFRVQTLRADARVSPDDRMHYDATPWPW